MALMQTAMGWLRSVGSIINYRFLCAEYRLFYRALLQKRLIILLIDPTNGSHPPHTGFVCRYAELFGGIFRSLFSQVLRINVLGRYALKEIRIPKLRYTCTHDHT